MKRTLVQRFLDAVSLLISLPGAFLEAWRELGQTGKTECDLCATGQCWSVVHPKHGQIHLVPRGDDIEHEAINDQCLCGPETLFDDESGCVLVTHHALDGRRRPSVSMLSEEG